MSLLATSAQFLLALLFVLGLIGLLANLARRFGLAPAAGRRPGGRRLGIAEILPLDGRRKAVLLRRDGVEHLVILSPTSETVVERAIAAPEPVAGGGEETAETAAPEATLLALPRRIRRHAQGRGVREAAG